MCDTLPPAHTGRTLYGHGDTRTEYGQPAYDPRHGRQARPGARRASGDPHEARGEGADRARRSARRGGHEHLRAQGRDPRREGTPRPNSHVENARPKWRGTLLSRTLYGMRKINDPTGQPFGRLRALGFLRMDRHGSVWDCLCDPELGGCGARCEAFVSKLRSGRKASCGCLQAEHRAVGGYGHVRVHGEARSGARTPEYRTWMAMVERCENPSNRGFSRYGGRGIRVCARWRADYPAFLADMGRKPTTKHSIDRVDNDNSYTCGLCDDCKARGAVANCRWATLSEQACNTLKSRRLEIRGVTKNITAWARERGMVLHTIQWRLARGWDAESAVMTPPRHERLRPATEGGA